MPFIARRVVLLPALILLITGPIRAADEPVKEPDKFVRFTDDKGGGRLETAVVTYKNADGVELKLVSAIHIGERSYFENLAKDFEAEDAVLYELVKEKDAPLPGPEAIKRKAAEGGEQHPIAQLQRFLKDTLKLDYQLDVIDYTKKNFVHADMDRAAFEKAQAERGESFESLMLHQLIEAMSKPAPDANAGAGAAVEESPEDMLKDLVKLVTRPDMERQLKTMLAKQMDQMQDAAMGLDGPKGSVLVTERNKAAIKALQETIKQGKKKLAIFYGAAHMPDLSKRVRELGFKPDGKIEWKSAWDLRIRADQPSAIEELLNNLIDGLGGDDAPAVEPARNDRNTVY